MDEYSQSPIAHLPGRPLPESLLAALVDPLRQRLMCLLLAEELAVTELVTILRLPQSTVSRHLKILKDADLIAARRRGAAILHRAKRVPREDDALRTALLNWLESTPLPEDVQGRFHRVLRMRDGAPDGFFERLGARWDELRASAFGEAFAFEAMISLLPASWRVADIGTGTGLLLPSLAEHFSEVIAVEPAERMLACARQRVADCGLENVTFHHGELGRLPIGEGACDVAIACLVIHHVADPNDALAEMHRVIRPGGRVLIVEQHEHDNQEFHEMMQDHWRGFDPIDLARRVAASGFEGVLVRPLRRSEGTGRGPKAPGLFALSAERKRT